MISRSRFARMLSVQTKILSKDFKTVIMVHKIVVLLTSDITGSYTCKGDIRLNEVFSLKNLVPLRALSFPVS